MDAPRGADMSTSTPSPSDRSTATPSAVSLPESFLWVLRRPLTKLRATTSTPTCGRWSTRLGRSSPTSAATHATATTGGGKTSTSCTPSGSTRTGSASSGRAPSQHPGQVSMAELAHYRRMIEGCFERGLTPVVTIHHFTTPLWFKQAKGWTGTDSLASFRRYVRAVLPILDGVEWVCTINEPNMASRCRRRSTPTPGPHRRGHAGTRPSARRRPPHGHAPLLRCPAGQAGMVFERPPGRAIGRLVAIPFSVTRIGAST